MLQSAVFPLLSPSLFEICNCSYSRNYQSELYFDMAQMNTHRAGVDNGSLFGRMTNIIFFTRKCNLKK